MTENWRDVPGYEGIYQASDCGRVKSLKRLDSIGRRRKGRAMKLSKHNKGYLQVSLCRDSKQTKRKVHRVVLDTFVGPRPKGKQCRHLDGSRTNNCLRNLRWGSQLENSGDRILHSRNGKKLTEHKARQIRSIHAPQREIAKLFGIDQSIVSRIKSRELWKHI